MIMDAQHAGFEFPEWDGISSEAKDFVGKLLVKKEDRLTISWRSPLALRSGKKTKDLEEYPCGAPLPWRVALLVARVS